MYFPSFLLINLDFKMSSSSGSTNSSSSTSTSAAGQVSSASTAAQKYWQLLALLEEVGRDLRPSCSGNRLAAERLKRNLVFCSQLQLYLFIIVN